MGVLRLSWSEWGRLVGAVVLTVVGCLAVTAVNNALSDRDPVPAPVVQVTPEMPGAWQEDSLPVELYRYGGNLRPLDAGSCWASDREGRALVMCPNGYRAEITSN